MVLAKYLSFYDILLLDYLSLGQSTQSPTYTCDQNDLTIQFTLSFSSHSAWDYASNCSLSQCMNNNNSCRSSSTPCFEHQTINNISYCAPAAQCSILEPCDNITNACSSNTSVCIVNSCCQQKAVCLPLSWTTLCPSTSQFFSDEKMYFD
jgi:hypothetical protein